MAINWFSVCGLILDIIGVILLYFYGLPSNLWQTNEDRKEEELRMQQENTSGSYDPMLDPAFKKHQRKVKNLSRIGMILIVCGFLLQLLAALGCCNKTDN